MGTFGHNRKHQKGAATLVATLAVLLLITLIGTYSSRSVFTEQKIMNNEARSRQAFEAAEAGLAAALTYMSNGRDRDADGVLDANVFDTTNDGIGDTNTGAVGTGRAIVTPTDLSGGSFNLIQVVSQGFSDDSTATRTITRIFAALNPLSNIPLNPLTTRGTTVINGSSTVVNPEGHTTIWSGRDVDLGSNNATHTEVPDATDPQYPTCMDTPRTCGTVSSSNKVIEGVDVIEQDSSLKNLSDSGFFENFLGMSPELYRQSMVTIDTVPANADVDVQLAANEVIWVEGDVTFDNNTTVGCTVVVTGSGVCAAANTKPSILIVNGDATFNGTPHVYGLVFVIGNMNVSGSTTIYGALMSAGELTNSTSGNLEIVYDSGILRQLRAIGPLASAAGSWRDFD
jgi:Tfp pilus assembly protein PilX